MIQYARMKKILSGAELAGYIKTRQAQQVRVLIQASGIKPKLAIVQCKDDPVINTYVRLKKKYGEDISVDVDIHRIEQKNIAEILNKLNKDDSVHGVIVQLPIEDPSQTEEIVNLVDPKKDVDALGEKATFDPATPMAILWLLAGYNIGLSDKKVLLIGRGKLVGSPLEKMLKDSGVSVSVVDRETKDLKEHTLHADVVVTATGSPSILFPDMFKAGAVIVDAGVASEEGKTVGDVSTELYERDDISITPPKGGVGPLTVCALFENVIHAARRLA
jgi:methylenetetrahydrofolate dehydrogenase (NADP+)/methenyltetrahydrofolate cyclohydrolase